MRMGLCRRSSLIDYTAFQCLVCLATQGDAYPRSERQRGSGKRRPLSLELYVRNSGTSETLGKLLKLLVK